MQRKELKNKPLVEAIFELRWKLKEDKNTIGIKKDPYYKILLGRIYDKVKEEYPYYLQLPTANMPDEIAGYVVQHQFRKDKDQWPLIQIGPGIITLNSTNDYIWEDFERRIANLLKVLFETYPESHTNLEVERLLLRYIDALDFNYEQDNIFDFLKEKMKVQIKLDKKLFENTGVAGLPLNFDLRFSFPSSKPQGAILLRFFKGVRGGSNALLWETQVQSMGQDIPKDKNEIISWAKESHILIDDWFFKIIEGDLIRRFE
ncbi:MAG: TIGR04255 family protein [Candidatus Caldatribacteriota bacterium]